MIYLFGTRKFDSAREAAQVATNSHSFRDTERALLAAKPGDIVYSKDYDTSVVVLSGVITSC